MPTSICTIRFQIRTILFAFRRGVGLPLPLHRPTPFPQPLQKDNTPTPRTTTLASLVKGRWIGGKAQTLTLLHLLAICSPFLYCKLFCRQDGGIATPPSLALHQPLQNRTIPPAFRNANIYMHDTLSHSHYPLPRTKLASLVKGEVLSPDKIRATTGGIATPPFLASHQPLQNRTIPPAFRNANIYMHDTLSNSHYPIRFS